jgi:hypothetical protein
MGFCEPRSLGREGTEMRSMSHRGSGIVEMQAAEIDDLIAYLRSNEDRTGFASLRDGSSP